VNWSSEDRAEGKCVLVSVLVLVLVMIVTDRWPGFDKAKKNCQTTTKISQPFEDKI
jgi:hypothetical protein